MAVTLTELAAALRLGDGVTAPVEPIAGVLARHQVAIEVLTDRYAPDAPPAIKDEATVRFVAYSYDSPHASSGGGFAATFRNSGAEALLSRFRRTAGGRECGNCH